MPDEEPTVRSAYIKETPKVVYALDKRQGTVYTAYANDLVTIECGGDEVAMKLSELTAFVLEANLACH